MNQEFEQWLKNQKYKHAWFYSFRVWRKVPEITYIGIDFYYSWEDMVEWYVGYIGRKSR
jgi:hypothetical protein